MARLPFGMDEYHMIGGDIHTAIHQVPEGDDATAKGFFNWLAGPVKKALHGVMGRKKLESLITLNRSGCAFAIASWKKLTSDMTRLRIPFPPQDVPSHRATLNELFLMTVPLPTDFDEDTKAKLKEMLEYNVRLIQEIPELIIVDVAQAFQWLKGEFDARVVGLRSAARSGKHEGRQEAVADAVVQSAVQELNARLVRSGGQARRERVDMTNKAAAERLREIAEIFKKVESTGLDYCESEMFQGCFQGETETIRNLTEEPRKEAKDALDEAANNWELIREAIDRYSCRECVQSMVDILKWYVAEPHNMDVRKYEDLLGGLLESRQGDPKIPVFSDELERWAKMYESASPSLPNDLISTAVAVDTFYISRSTLRRHKDDGSLISYRSPNAAPNSKDWWSEAEIAKSFTRRPNK